MKKMNTAPSAKNKLRAFALRGPQNRALSLACLVCSVALPALGTHSRTDSFHLAPGWNAIYLSVEPIDNDPNTLFAETPVDQMAVFDERFTTQQFTSNPTTDMLRQLGWALWFAPQREDAFLSDLSSMAGQKGYLIHATQATTLQITGTVTQQQPHWKPNAFNLVGFRLSPTTPPSFSQFFSGAPALRDQAIYRMVNGSWQRVTQPATTAMKSGEAFWIYCNDRCDYTGPLSATTASLQGIILEDAENALTLRNTLSYPLQPTINHVVTPDAPVPLSIAVDVLTASNDSIESIPVSLGDGAWTQPLPPLEENGAIRIPFMLRGNDVSTAEVTSLLCITTDLGTETWIPVTGLREDVQ